MRSIINHTVKYNTVIIAALIACTLLGCSKFDEFRKYQEGGQIVYTGKPDSLQVLPGKNRAAITAILNDPKVVKLAVYWKNHTDSAIIPVTITPGKRDTFYIPGLPEGVISFDVRTYDKDGNTSVPANVTGSVYGNNYSQTLLNRGINQVVYNSPVSLDIHWATPDTINTVTELFYTNSGGQQKQILIPADSTHTRIDDFNSLFPNYYRSYYKPFNNAIDTFATITLDSLSNATSDVTQAYLKNAKQPLVSTPASGTDRFRTLADWTTTPNVLNANGVGGWVSDDNTCISMEVGWGGKSPIIDGKIYQTITLPAGLYSFITSPLPRKDGPGGCTMYVAVAKATTLPNTNDVPASAFAWRNLYDEQPLNFTLSQPTTISIGFVATMPNGNYLQWSVNVIKLLKL